MKLIFTICFFVCTNLAAQTQLKILTYNIFHGEQAYIKQEPNLDDIAKLINELKPDLAAFQEVDSATGRSEGIYKVHTDFIATLAQKTGMYGFFGKAMDFDGGGYGEGLLSRKPAKSIVTKLPTPKGGEPRALIYIKYPLSKNRNLVFAGTHLCHQYDENRVAQTEQINKEFSESKDPVVLCGDLNFMPGKPPYAILQSSWEDAGVLKGSPENTFSSQKPFVRIDYTWLKKGFKWKVIDMQVLPYSYSDHKPVLITLEIQ